MLKLFSKYTLAPWAIGSATLAGAASVAYVLISPSDAPDPTPPIPSVVQGEPAGVDLPQVETAPDMQITMAAPTAIQPPSFDLVRMTDLGDVLVAGKAPARSAVSVLIDEAPVAQAVSTAEGEFVLMFEVDPSPAARMLQLEVRLPDGNRLRSVDTLMLAPRSSVLASADTGEAEEQEHHSERMVVEAAQSADTSPDTSSEPEADGPRAQQAAAARQTAQPAQPETESPEPRAPVAVLMRADGGVQVLGEAATPTQSASGGNVTIDAVTYDARGEVTLSGRTRLGAAEIQIYLDNQPILRTRASPDGNWQAQLDGIERGIYQLRIDELDDAAQVTSRAEIPFERVTPEVAREAGGMQALIVQPGNTLWAMSREQFGDGGRYMRIFDANRDQIRNPDLIYPGQVFILPPAVD